MRRSLPLDDIVTPRLLIRWASFLGLGCLVGCAGPEPPTTEDIRSAYAAHMRRDPVHEIGLSAQAPPAVIPNQSPICTSDGGSHFDCRIRVIFETKGRKRSDEEKVHIRRDGESWIIDSLN